MNKLLNLIRCVNGPYIQKGRRFIIVHYKDGSKKSLSNARYTVELALDRILSEDETVDHIDGDALNDRLDNLQILTLEDNSRKSASSGSVTIHFTCPNCGGQGVQFARDFKWNQKRSPIGPFCSKVCAGQNRGRERYATDVKEVVYYSTLHVVSWPISYRYEIDHNYTPPYPQAKNQIAQNKKSLLKEENSENIRIQIYCCVCNYPCNSKDYWHRKCLSCIDCGNRSTSLRCRSCSNKMLGQGNVIDWPKLEEVINLVKDTNYWQAGKKLGVSDNAVRKHLKHRGIDPKTLTKIDEKE